jgi:hypothetical protein
MSTSALVIELLHHKVTNNDECRIFDGSWCGADELTKNLMQNFVLKKA